MSCAVGLVSTGAGTVSVTRIARAAHAEAHDVLDSAAILDNLLSFQENRFHLKREVSVKKPPGKARAVMEASLSVLRP